jgi:hypothetical protein
MVKMINKTSKMTKVMNQRKTMEKVINKTSRMTKVMNRHCLSLVHHLCLSTGFLDHLCHFLSLVHHLCHSTGLIDHLFHCLSLEQKKDNGEGDQQDQ